MMSNDISQSRDRKPSVAAAGGVIGAVLASSCCIGPLVLITLGASGAWIGNLTALKAYQPVFVTVTLAFLGFGYWQVYGKSRPNCEDGNSCATPASDRIVKSALWIATVLVALALTTDLWAPLFY
jgi:mercuric ion transport protein